jgi:hypothetical protein
MTKGALIQWAMKALIAYLKEHGDEMIQEIIEWLSVVLLGRMSDEPLGKSLEYVPGREEWCAAALKDLEDLEEQAGAATS